MYIKPAILPNYFFHLDIVLDFNFGESDGVFR